MPTGSPFPDVVIPDVDIFDFMLEDTSSGRSFGDEHGALFLFLCGSWRVEVGRLEDWRVNRTGEARAN